VKASTASAAAMDSGTAPAPMRLARATDGCAPVSRAARGHNSQASAPVTNRFSPRFSPMGSAKGRQGHHQHRGEDHGRQP
jgi:hypothetical protein